MCPLQSQVCTGQGEEEELYFIVTEHSSLESSSYMLESVVENVLTVNAIILFKMEMESFYFSK